jgi:hypothetical protein
MQSVVILKITNPITGEEMASLWVVVRRGIRIPFVADLTSSIELASGGLPSALMDTWARPEIQNRQVSMNTNPVFAFINWVN